MSEQEMPARRGIDRRDALKKAAVAGGVVWAAPTLLSSTASAQTACTLKCAPVPVVTFSPQSKLYCPANGRKWVEIDFSISGTQCPCGGASPTLTVSRAAVSGGNAQVYTFGANGGSGFVIFQGQGQGSLSDGDYTGSVTFRVTCDDKSGRTISRSCTQAFSFGFHPGDGPCSTNENVGAVTAGTLNCGVPTCGAA